MVLCVTTDSIEAGVSGQANRCGGNRGDGSTHITAAPANYQAPKYTRWGVVIAQLEGSLQDVDDFCVIAAVGSRSTPGGAADCRGGFDDVLLSQGTIYEMPLFLSGCLARVGKEST